MAPVRKKPRASSVRKHEVKADLANFELAKARPSLTLQIYAYKENLGELEIAAVRCIGKAARNRRASGSTGRDSPK